MNPSDARGLATLRSALMVLGATAACMLSGRAEGADPLPFANHLRFIPTGPTTFDLTFEEGPFDEGSGLPSLDAPPLPGWSSNVIASISSAGGPPEFDESTMIATLPIFDTMTAIARDAFGAEIGRLELLGVGEQKLDLNADHAIVDEQAGVISVQFGGPLLGGDPSARFSLVSTTGIYSSDVLLLEEGLSGYVGGKFLFPLDENPATSLQENILQAFAGGQLAGLDVVGVWTGVYVPEPASVGMLVAGGLFVVAAAGRGSRRS